MVQSLGVKNSLSVFQCLRDYRVIKGELDRIELHGFCPFDEGLVRKYGTGIGGRAGPAVGFDFVVAHFV